ncbi:hypothetical protein Gpo141_00001969 [Globisporangium polare]
MQRELKQLRALSVELEQRLVRILQRQRGEAPQSQQELAMLTAWEYIANCQQRERARAETENAQLRARVQNQLVVLRNLQQAASQLPGFRDQISSMASSGGLFDLRKGFPARSSIALEDVAIYETLTSEVDAAFLSMEGVFVANGLSSWRSKDASELWTQAQMKTQRSSETAEGSNCIEITDVDVLPFAKESVFRAMWQCWEQQYASKNCDVYELDHLSFRSDTVAGKMRYHECVDSERVPLEIQFVLKLFVECDRICYVWRSRSTASTSLAEVCIEETWWEELRTVLPAPDSDVNSFEGTLMLSCSQMESITFTKSSASSTDATTITAPLLVDAVVSSYEVDMVDVTCRMMDVLLEETAAALPQAV